MITYIIGGLVLLLIGLGFLYWSDKSVILTNYKLKSDKLPPNVKKIRIAHVSDLQSQYFGRGQKNIINIVKNSQPDFIVFTGDLLDRNHTNFEAAFTLMEGLVKIAPVYYVNGNHEFVLPEKSMNEFYKKLESAGVNILFDRVSRFEIKKGSKICIAGISEKTLYESKFFGSGEHNFSSEPIEKLVQKIEAQLSSEELNIMLVHEPQYLEHYDNLKTDFIFAGHAHGGQIRLFGQGLFSPGQGFFPRLTSGINCHNHSKMVISRGLGNSTFPFRVFNRPEIVLTEIGNSRD